MKPPPAPVRELLAYLHEIGWEELYLEPSAPSQATRDGAETTTVGSAEDQPPDAASRAPTDRTDERQDANARDEPPGARADPGTETDDRPDPAHVEDLESLAVLAGDCTACPLAEGRQNVVFGSGASSAELMFVGEGPGAQEDRQGLPFVGPAGELLTRIIEAIELRRDDVYIANVVKCRPPGNRDPHPNEVAACHGFLKRQIELVRPKVIVALGRVAAQSLLETDTSLGRLRGAWHSFEGVPLRVTYHPAALLRNAQWKRPTWEDMQIVRKRLDEEAAT